MNAGVDFASSQAVSLEDQAARASGMTTAEERRFLKWYAQIHYSGEGDWVDLGSWLGSSVIAAACGLRQNPREFRRAGRLHAYDRFVWDSSMEARVCDLRRIPSPGESFLDEFRTRILPWRDLIEVHPGDLSRGVWPGGSIEFMFIDAMKSWELCRRITATFFPALIPGRALVAHQDFKWRNTPWIHLTTFRLREALEPVYDVPGSCTLVFRVRRPISRDLCRQACDFATFTVGEIKDAFEYGAGLCSESGRAEVAAAQGVLFHWMALESLGSASNLTESAWGALASLRSRLGTPADAPHGPPRSPREWVRSLRRLLTF